MAVKKKTAKKKIAKKISETKQNASTPLKKKIDTPPAVEKDDSRVIGKIKSNTDDDSAGTVEKISDDKSVVVDDSDLTPTVSADSEAIQKTKSKKAKGRPMKRSNKPKKSDKPGKIDDTITQMLKPDALKTIITIANNRLKEADSIWAMPDGECDDMANAIIGVVDKYFPELDEWSVEATLIITASMYAIPRFMMMKQSAKVEVPKTEPVKEAEPELEKAPAPEPQKSTDPRLDKYN